MKRREFIAGLGGAAAWPVVAQAQHSAMPVIGFLSGFSPSTSLDMLDLLRQGLGDIGYFEHHHNGGRPPCANAGFRHYQRYRLSSTMPAPEARADMRRRKFLVLGGGAAVAFPIAARAQTSRKVPRVGTMPTDNPPPGDSCRQAEWFKTGLHKLGWEVGISDSYRLSIRRRPARQATEHGSGACRSARRRDHSARSDGGRRSRDATNTIGIVMAADPDPVGNGFIKSLARPGGNITGFSTQAFESQG